MYNSAGAEKTGARIWRPPAAEMDKSIKKLHKAIAKVDPTIQGTIARAEKRIATNWRNCGTKRVRPSTVTKNRSRNTRNSENLLYPQRGNLQSRDLCFLPFLAAWGSGSLRQLQKAAKKACGAPDRAYSMIPVKNWKEWRRDAQFQCGCWPPMCNWRK